MTHPFHPWCGREFEVVDVRCWRGETRLHFYDDEGGLLSIPAGWTDLGEADPFVARSGGRAHFRIDDLLRLAALVDGLREA
ncbi:MAG: hypothetical protein JRJ84_07255 [Deltaproteobacteria bacterium]|nr:hypothetical protein [Deltaproteobacteria bacterium]